MTVVACVFALIWLAASAHEMQQALQWWSQRQFQQQWQESELIRNGVLQRVFTLRRSLELSLIDQAEVPIDTRKDWLEQFEWFHYTLETLGDRLFPAYVEESLPLMLQAVIQQWQTHHADLNIETKLPTQWRQESADRSRIISMTLIELLEIGLPKIAPFLQISLSAKGRQGELVVQMVYPDQASLFASYRDKEWVYLSRSFQFLTSGWCFQQREGLMVTWHFRWR